MSDFIFIRKSRNLLSSVLHVVLNILLGMSSIALTVITGSWLFGILLVLLSKWRMFAVRPYYWWLNIKSNLVDLIVGSSFVLVAFSAGTTVLPIHIILGFLYAAWLVALKPLSSELATKVQALVAVFIGATSVTLLFAGWPSIALVTASFVIGYGASRHVIVQSEDKNFGLINLIFGLLLAEIAWISHSWLIVYSFGESGIVVPQLAILLTLFTFAFGNVYLSVLKNDGKIKAEVILPVAFSLLLAVIMVLWFSNPIFNV